ncbi:hypothetical protein F52700_8344 [Fusarium sp. NRRL 52700]|nr:hypothetical protein F52700_8344 [Fusarium sp. NRRL 52700]
MDTEIAEYGSIARQNRELAEWHRNADYSIVYPPKNKTPWLVAGKVPKGLRVLETQAEKSKKRISVTCAAKYLSVAIEVDFLSYVDVVVPDIVGPANYVLHGDGFYYRDIIDAYSDNPFALHPNTQNQDLIAHIQSQVLGTIFWREDGSYKSTDSYIRHFPLGFPTPNSNDEKAFGEHTLDDLYRTLILQEFLFRQTYDESEESRCKKLVRTIPPKADSQWLGYSVGRSEPPWVEQSKLSAVDRSFIMRLPRELQFRIIELASSPQVTPTLRNRPIPRRSYSRVQSTWEDSMLALKLSSRMIYDLDIDTLRVFDMGLPEFHTTNGPSTLPVRKLLSISKIIPKSCATHDDTMWLLESPVGEALDLEKLPKLDEFSAILPSVAESWMIEDLPRVRPQVDVLGVAHIGIKCHFNGSEKPSMHPNAPILDEAIPYVGRWGYERKTKDVYFTPLSWNEVGENGREALYEDHTPRFVAKLRIMRQKTTPPTGWIKVEQARQNDPKWKRQLLNTWKSVWYTLVDRRTKVNLRVPPPKSCDYFPRQT